jgi:hypothetical protein
VIDYFDPSTYFSQPRKYRLINCLAHIAGFALNNPEIHQYQYEGTTYRGLSLFNHLTLQMVKIGKIKKK